MDKLNEIAIYITQYGYIAIFLFVFLQEIGIPNPITNELVLMFGGYLSYTHTLSLYKVILVSITADVTGTSILFVVFYLFGKWVLKHKPAWLPLKASFIERLERYVTKRGQWSIYIGRLTPFLRGYVSVAAGLLHVKPQKFLGTVMLSAVTWSGGLVVLGWLLAPYWGLVLKNMGMVENIVLVVLLAIGIAIAGKYFTRRQMSKAIEDELNTKDGVKPAI